jgi:hypothetical protein
MYYVFKYIHIKLKRNFDKEQHNLWLKSTNYVLSRSQLNAYPEVVNSLSNGDYSHPLVTQMNLFISGDGLVRVQSKLRKLKASYGERCPVLLHKNCPVAMSIIYDTHRLGGHGGIYKTLSALRKEFWIGCGYVTVRKILKNCTLCRRLNNRTIKLSQNAYKDYRVNPTAVPFRNVGMDHCGPFFIKDRGNMKVKIYIL